MLLQRFFQDRRASVASMFAISIIPVIGFIGAAVDYSRASSAKTAMQAALDSTALMLAKEAPNLTTNQLKQKAADYFKAMFNRPDAVDIAVTPTYTAANSKVVITGTGSVQSSFMKVLGIDHINFGTSATVVWGTTRLRVALALDVTGSMASAGKITALKTAAHNLINTLKAAAQNNGDVYVSIVPFSKDVNVGSAYKDATWLDWSDWEDDNGTWQTSQTCSTRRSRRGRTSCQNNQTWVPASHSTWNGCVTDRDQDFDTLSTAPKPTDITLPDNQASTLFFPEQYSSCPAKLLPMTYDWSALNDKIDELQPAGNTNQGIGLAWAWLSLLPQSPLNAPAMTANLKYNQVIILMSDGLNTENRWYTNQNQIDAREKLTCDHIKAAGITIYTIHVNTDGDPKSTVLENCATTKDKFWMLTSANQMIDTFNQIGVDLSNLRIAN